MAQKAAGIADMVTDKVGGVFDFKDEHNHRPGGAQIVSPHDRTARKIEESHSSSKAEITIKDETNRAEVTKGKLGAGILLTPTGAF